jgi:hypothetical protein
MRAARWILPLAVIVAAVGWVVWGHVARVRAQAVATGFVTRLHESQQAFRTTAGGFASELDSLTRPCPAGRGPWLEPAAIDSLTRAGYVVVLRPRAGASVLGSDCHGRAVVNDYYVGVAPASPRAAGQHAYGSTSDGRVYVFVDGVAPNEADMSAGGLATPLEEMPTFRIP